jgi:hypothetical protein
MLKDYVERLKTIYEICPDKDIYLYGQCLFDIIQGKEVLTLDLLVKSKKIDDQTRIKLENTYHFNIKADKNFDFSDEYFQMYCIYCSVKDFITQDKINIEGKYPAVIDLNKRNVRFTDKAKSELSVKPHLMLDAILLSCELGFTIELSSMRSIITHKSAITKIETRKIYHFLRDVFFRSKKTRKSISLINTLGLSRELFGRLLVESSITNNLSKKDVFEYFAIIFDSIPKKDLDTFLTQKVGFFLRDAAHVIDITKIIELVHNTDVRDRALAKKVIELYGVDKIGNANRLFKAMGLNEFAHLIRKEKSINTATKNMSLTVEMIMNVFLVDELEAKILLEQAKELCILEPELVNNSSKLIIMLNKSRMTEHHLHH